MLIKGSPWPRMTSMTFSELLSVSRDLGRRRCVLLVAHYHNLVLRLLLLLLLLFLLWLTAVLHAVSIKFQSEFILFIKCFTAFHHHNFNIIINILLFIIFLYHTLSPFFIILLFTISTQSFFPPSISYHFPNENYIIIREFHIILIIKIFVSHFTIKTSLYLTPLLPKITKKKNKHKQPLLVKPQHLG